MLAAERRRIITERIKAVGQVVVSALSAEFAVSEETIRRDLESLERDGIAVRIYGGAVLLPNGKVFYSAPWIYLYTAIMSLWAVWFGTEDYRRSERVLRKWQKAQSKLAAPYKPIDLPVGAKDLPRCRPYAMRALRGRRPHGSRRMRTVHTIKPIPMTPVAKKKF